MQDLIMHLSDKTEDSNIKFKISDHRSPTYLYKRVKKFQSDSHRIEFFYNRIPTAYVRVNAYIRVTVVKKDALTYLNHARLLLGIENILKSYDYHVCSVELALDCSSTDEFKRVTEKAILKYSRPKNIFHCTGQRSKNGKVLKIPGHDTSSGTRYFNGMELCKQLKYYKIDEDETDRVMEGETPSPLDQKRSRIEFSLKRKFLRRKNLNTFSEILQAGPELFFNQVDLIHFDKKAVFRFIRRSKSKRKNQELCSLSEGRLKSILEKSSSEILTKLLKLLNMTPYRIKSKLGEKLPFPKFIFDAPPINNTDNKTKTYNNNQPKQGLSNQFLLIREQKREYLLNKFPNILSENYLKHSQFKELRERIRSP